MALIKSIKNFTPIFSKNVFLAENATVIGDVIIGENTSIWYNTVIRGDVGKIKIGNNVNIQDGVVIHSSFKKSKTIIGNNITIGHNAIIHGCSIKDNVMIGMGAIIMDNSIIEKNTIIAAGSVVLENTIIKSGQVFGGVPARRIKKITENEANQLTTYMAKNYIKYSNWHKEI